MTQKNIKVLVVRDGRPGHEKQSLGIVAALKKQYAIEVQEVRVKPGYKALLKSISLFIGTLPKELKTFKPDILLGTGSHTHLPVLALKRRLGGRTVICMSPMRILRNHFDLCCIPRHDEISEGKNIFLTEGPPGLNIDLGHHEVTTALVLVGGVDEKSHVWDSCAIAETIAATMRKFPEFNWTLTTSPRTPPEFINIFSQYQKELRVKIYPFAETSPGWLEINLQLASWVLVTEDSLSMIFEALSAGCRVATIPVEFNDQNKFVRCIQSLKKQKIIALELDPLLSNTQKPCFNEANRCGSEIIKRFIEE